MDYLIIIQAFWIVIPIYVANASAVIVGGGPPIDFGKTWRDGKRIFGDGKTWIGLLSGTFIGMTAGFGLVVAATYLNTGEYSYLGLADFERFPIMFPIIFSLCFGALLGDIIESFFKRRRGISRGEDWIGFDQLDFLLGAMFFCFLMSVFLQGVGLTDGNWFLDNLLPWQIIVLLVATPFFHFVSNFLHRKIKRSKAKA